MHTAILTREFPPDIYGGAGVHVDYLVRELRKLIEVDVHAFGADRPGAFGHRPAAEVADVNPALATQSVDLSMTAGCGNVDLVHSHTWYANMAGHFAKLLYGVPHVVTAHSLEPRRPWKAEQLGGGYRLSSWAEKTAYEAADASFELLLPWSPFPTACAQTSWTATRRWTPPGCTSSATASTPRSTTPSTIVRC